MNDFTVDFDWIDPMGARGTELRATWASLQIICNTSVITRVHSYSSRSVRDSVYLPLYPLAEWIALHWWFLQSEFETVGTLRSQSYSNRHSLRYAGEGFGLPNLIIRPLGKRVQLEWKATKDPLREVDYLEEGIANLDSIVFQNKLKNFVTAVVRRLEDTNITDTLLQNEWRNILSMDEEEIEFCQATAALGLDPQTLSPDEANSIIDVSTKLPTDILSEFFNVAEPKNINLEAQEILKFIETSQKDRKNWSRLKDIRTSLSFQSGEFDSPWKVGYEYARNLRRFLRLDGKPLQGLDSLGKLFKIDDLGSRLNEENLNLPTIDSMVAVNSKESPVFVLINHQQIHRVETNPFAFCRALFEYLVQDEHITLNLITKARSDRQKANRAFAAEFLVPAKSLKSMLSSAYPDSESIDVLASHFGVSPQVIQYQIVNHKLANVDLSHLDF
jgi:hypothetical protein